MAAQRQRSALVEIVLPVYNEAAILSHSVARVQQFLSEDFPLRIQLTIADNGSDDDTFLIAQQLANESEHVRAVRIPEKGRGRALRWCWERSSAEVVAYMDIDLSTDLAALYPLIAPILAGTADLSIGTRLAPEAHVIRGVKRELISRAYNRIVRTVLGTSFSDAQCGFKAIRTSVAQELLPAVANNEWFFDTELLVLADRLGYRIWEVPVEWSDDPDSRVRVVHTAREDLAGIARVLRADGPVRTVRDRVTERRTTGDHSMGGHA